MGEVQNETGGAPAALTPQAVPGAKYEQIAREVRKRLQRVLERVASAG